MAVLLICGSAFAQEVKEVKDKVSYKIGFDIGSNLKKQTVDVNPDILSQGIRDALLGSKPLFSDKELHEAMTAFQKDYMTRQEARNKDLAEKNKKEGETFLAENKKKPGVKTTHSGLQYKVIKEGDGPMPKIKDTVVAHYAGTLIDGTEFDSSIKRGQPSSFPVSGVIAGWTEALQMMKTGSKWQLFIPSNLAYGERGAQGTTIGPNATLIFEVELISVKEGK